MQPLKKLNIVLFGLFLCLASQMHSVEFEGSKLPPREEFARSISTRAHEWLYQKEIAARRLEKIHNTDLENAKQWTQKRNSEQTSVLTSKPESRTQLTVKTTAPELSTTGTSATGEPGSQAETFKQELNTSFEPLKTFKPSSRTEEMQPVSPKAVNQSIERLHSNDIPDSLQSLSSSQIAFRRNENLSANRPQTSEDVASAYQTLHLNPNVVDRATITQKYKELALQYHPDKPNGNKEAFQALQSAFQTIQKHLESAATPSYTHSIGHDTPKQILGNRSYQSIKDLGAIAQEKLSESNQSERTLPEIAKAEKLSEALNKSKEIGARYQELTSKVSTAQENLNSQNQKLHDDAISREEQRLSESEKYKITLQENHAAKMRLVDLHIKNALEIVNRHTEEKFLTDKTKALKESQSAINQKEKEIEEIYKKAPEKDQLSLENNAELTKAFESYKLLESEKETLLASLKNIGTLVNPKFKAYQADMSQDDYIKTAMNAINDSNPGEKEKYKEEIINLAKKRNNNLSNISDKDLIEIGLKIGYSDSIYEGLIESIISDPFNYQAKFNALKKQFSATENSLPTEEIKNQILSELCPSTKDLSSNQKNDLFEKLNKGESLQGLLEKATDDKAAQELADIAMQKEIQSSKEKNDQLEIRLDEIEKEANARIERSEQREQSKNQLLDKRELVINTLEKSISKPKLTKEQIAENRAKAPKLNPARAAELQQKREQANNELNENLKRQINEKAQAIQDLMDEQEKDEQTKKGILNESEMDRRSRISAQEAQDFNTQALKFQTRIGEQRQKENTAQEPSTRSKLLAQEQSELKHIQAFQEQIKAQHEKETTAKIEELAQEEKKAQELQQRLIDLQEKSDSNKQALVSGETNARTSIETNESDDLKSIEAQIAAIKQKEIFLNDETQRKSINISQETELEDLRQTMLSEVTQLKQAEQKAKDLAEANKASKIDRMIKAIERNLKTPAELAKDKAEKEAEDKKTISKRNEVLKKINTAQTAIRIADSHNSNLEKTIAKESLDLLNKEKETLLKSAGTLVSQSFKPFSQTIDDFSKQITTAENELLTLANQIKEITDNLNKLSSTDNSLAAKKIRSENSKLKTQQADLKKKISGLKTAQQSSFEAISSYIKTDFPFDYQAKLNKLIEESQAKKPISKVDKIKLIEQMIPQIKNLTDDKKELISNLFYSKVSRN